MDYCLPVKRKAEDEDDSSPSIWSSQQRQRPRRPTKRPCLRHPNDVEDIGIVAPNADPGPATGSLLQLRKPPTIPIDATSSHIASHIPPISRTTLKELDLDAIMRNPQLRHDLLFDGNLQFRPTSTRRKTERAEKYWQAITTELETGCTCVSFDIRGKPHPTVCACAHVSTPAVNPVVAYSPTLHVATLRMPSRIRALLEELLEVLLLVIQPLSTLGGAPASPTAAQQADHLAQAAYIRSVFDPALIEQELKHKLFDPSSLFRAIGLTLQGHCAPMRDQAVELMVQLAQTCAPGGNGTKADAVRAVRMCMDILELMKLDIANHQLQTLRPFLIRTSGQFELRSFKSRKNGQGFQKTREWLAAAHASLLARSDPIPIPYPPGQLHYQKLQRNQQIYLSTLRGLTDLVFTSPSPANLISLPISVSQGSLPTISSLPGHPETTYLDTARLLLLNIDAGDLTALSMFLLLFRQLRFSTRNGNVDESELCKIKGEIRDIGSARLGYALLCGKSYTVDKEELDKWRSLKQSVVLQIAMRARGTATSVDESVLSLAQRWADENIQHGAILEGMLRNRLRDAVFHAVVSRTFPGRDSVGGETPMMAGMEVLQDEINTLAENISRLALIHINTYLAVYESENFLETG
ncbi:Vacuolar ATP synthase subunit B [Mycena indigotica]|uniref:Vacuolar ATP synthase subunit B n=1 Tax=Mycena indigotica TaxID=2126181 RepID=A0A8H6SJR0_9AGAR|nr:Vacuolar ATP synthase subunit B [Mycena indigotica]KAF7299110.1 Vacuolar ATP synthase subunit B [Mycena indigotica]